MYRAHSKDINRNKSFHPLTYKNLRRVEILKEGEEDKKQRAAERQKELQRDQEERRYDELVIANSADSLSGELARFRQTKNIFKAEYEAEAAKRQHDEVKEAKESKTSNLLSSSSAVSASPFASSSNSFLSKFKKESNSHPHSAADSSRVLEAEVKAEPTDESTPSSNKPAAAAAAHGKRRREDEDADREKGNSSGVTTGFVTSAEATQLRKEVNLAQKLRHDPLLRVQQYQNTCVANAARQQQHRDGDDALNPRRGSRADSRSKDNSDALQSRIRELLALKKK